MRAIAIFKWLKVTPKGIKLRAITRIPGAIRAAKIAAWNLKHPFRKLP